MKWVLEKELKDDHAIERFEKLYGYKLPNDYKKVVKKHNAGRPRPNVFDTATRKELVAKSLLSYDEEHLDNIWSTYQNLKNRLPANALPFMGDQFGNYICFMFDPLEDEPTIVFWQHELGSESVQVIASNFEEFLQGFYEI
ncbi:SMI1/KNR4 family protein [Sporosarcina luteola]|uniref:SMI1/KNR4 family protein n=1 Tax=Sporosarcina luteola TaxID=582850 RepID=A0A511Z326_9BACL|nr:SMI1/KNR4 family protein [Sporosarcina luteola]GEN81840.1 SMI1/KNR4 family protein [Sporosarcina luteola]